MQRGRRLQRETVARSENQRGQIRLRQQMNDAPEIDLIGALVTGNECHRGL